MSTLRNSIHNAVYPGNLSSLWLIYSTVVAVHFLGKSTPFDLAAKFTHLVDETSTVWAFVACFLAALLYWLTIIFILRYTLKWCLMYNGWMYEGRGDGRKTSLPTKLWVLGVKILTSWSTPGLYSFQGLLPRLPVPSLHDTTARYLRSVRPLLDDQNYQRMHHLASEFENGIGRKLQMYLWLKSWWSSNYVSDWWQEYVYLRRRSPLMIDSNFYGIGSVFTKLETSQAARAASVVSRALTTRRLIDRQELEPIRLQGLIPICCSQYKRLFNTTRIPGLETDQIQHWDESDHIVVYHKGRYFKVVIYEGRILKPCEIQAQMEQILNDKSEPLPGEEGLAALTAGERTHWAKIRQRFFSTGANKIALDTIEKAAFVLILDDFPYEYDREDPSKLDNYGKILMHGKGYDRWFDKSCNLLVGSNGRIGFNAEHSWADGAIPGHLGELLILCALDDRCDENGNLVGTPDITTPRPTRLNWEMSQECQGVIEESVRVAKELIDDFDLRVYIHDNYGKRFIKWCRLSPDAYLQMAFQLAYFRDAGKFALTYESSTTRLFREGRTETVRSCSVESSAWVKAMDDPEVTADEKKLLLKQSCERHQTAYKDAMCGKGVDRHLFCLYVVLKYLKAESPFLEEVLNEPWRLSTSQVPYGHSGKTDKHPDYISTGGGFGPVANDGYGVSYIMVGEDVLSFHISNKKNCYKTDCHRFARGIEKALSDMKELFVDDRTQHGNKLETKI